MSCKKASDKANTTEKIWAFVDIGTRIVKKTADVSVDILSNFTGPVGKRIKDVYTVAYKIDEGLGEGIRDQIFDGKNTYKEKILNGTVNGFIDLGFNKIMDKVGDSASKNFKNKIPGFKKYSGKLNWDKM